MHWLNRYVLRSSGALLIALMLGDLVGAQVTQISKEEFTGKYFAAVESAQALTRRETTRTERFRNGGLIGKEEWILEYDSEYRSHFVHSTVIPKVSRTEMIVSGEKIFCKTLGEAWKQAEGLCLVGPIFNQVLGIVSSKYSVQDTVLDDKRVRLYTEYVTHKNPTNKGDGRLRFMETKFWLNEKGSILKRHVRVGVVGTEEISFDDVYSYEYDPPGLKIEVPIP